MPIQLQLGFEVIQSYKRLSYTPWHAIAELVDNATQSYFDNQAVLDAEFAASGDKLTIGVVYERANRGMIRVSDNAMGMSFDELQRALHVGIPPANTSGRSKYGLGMKTSACWIGMKWTVRTKKLGETQEHRISVDVDKISSGDNDLSHEAVDGKSPDDHYTVIEVYQHNQVFQGRTIGKIKDFLRSMYRQDLRQERMTFEWQGSALEWHDSMFQFLQAKDGSLYKKDFEFEVNSKKVYGWVGVLRIGSGSRAKAGFSILRSDRVVRGWPDSWRPESIYGFQGRNDLINQRLVGEIHLDTFEVSHTKDDILWVADEQEEVERLLKEACNDYVAVARRPRKGDVNPEGPTQLETATAVDELVRELSSAELADLINLEAVPPPETVRQAVQPLKDAVSSREPTFRASLAQFEILGFLVSDLSINDPYVVVDSTEGHRVLIIVNVQHPHWSQLSGSGGVLNYLRHCTFDGISEWQARYRASSLDPDTIKILKDKLLRLPLEIEMHQDDATDEDAQED